MSSANPFSRGSAIIVILFFLFGVSAKHFSDEVSTTVSQKDTTGSATKNERGLRWIDGIVKTIQIRTFDIDFRIHFPEVVHHAVEVKFACSKDHVLTRLLHSR